MAFLRWPCELSIDPFSWATPGLLRVGTAAFRNLDRDAQEDLTTRYEELVAHYGMMKSCRCGAALAPLRVSTLRRPHRQHFRKQTICCARSTNPDLTPRMTRCGSQAARRKDVLRQSME